MMIFQPDRHLIHGFVASHAPSFAGDVLDVGGGTGRYRHLFANVSRYRILDCNPATHPDIVASAERIPLADASVDGVICTQVLGDVWKLHDAVAELVRIVKPGGLLLITESLHCEQHDEPYDFWRFTSFAWRAFFEPSCDVLTIETRGGYFSLRAQQRVRRLILRHKLYERPFLGRVAHLYASLIGRFALWRDANDRRADGERFALGHNLLLRKR